MYARCFLIIAPSTAKKQHRIFLDIFQICLVVSHKSNICRNHRSFRNIWHCVLYDLESAHRPIKVTNIFISTLKNMDYELKVYGCTPVCISLLPIFLNSLCDDCGLRYGMCMACGGHHGAFSLCVFRDLLSKLCSYARDILSKLR